MGGVPAWVGRAISARLAAAIPGGRSAISFEFPGRSGRRVLAIGLDGFELSLADRLIAEGRMPRLAAQRARSARFLLDLDLDKNSGLAWRHVSSGIAPRDGGRWSAVTFDPKTYKGRQDATRARPFLADLSGPA